MATPLLIPSSSRIEFLDLVTAFLKHTRDSEAEPRLLDWLQHCGQIHGFDIERTGSTKQQKFLDSVTRLETLRESTINLTNEILRLNQNIQVSTVKLAEQKGALVNLNSTRQNIADTFEYLKGNLEILHAVNRAQELIRRKRYYPALRSLEDLQKDYLRPVLPNRLATQHGIADLVRDSIPESQKAILDAVMADLNLWLFRIRETSQFLGEVAFFRTELRRSRQKKRYRVDGQFLNFKLNSSIEVVCEENEDFDVLDNEELKIDFSPLFEALHIHAALGQVDNFRSRYAATRRQQKDLLLPSNVDLSANNSTSLSSLLEDVAGFAIIEKATMWRAPYVRSSNDTEELWGSMCNTAISLIRKALYEVSDAEVLLKVKSFIALFIQTMEDWGYSVQPLDSFLLTLFDEYAELLKRRFSEDFQEIVFTDDYMPMAVNSIEEYEKVINVSWFTHSTPTKDLVFPCVLPFSQMYPLCCIDIRNFLNQFYFFADDHFLHSNMIDETLRKVERKQALDELLIEKVCKSLVERLGTQYLGQIVQILINLEHFEIACGELEQLLIRARSFISLGGRLKLAATGEFRKNKKTAEKRIFELVNSKIDDLVDTAEYDWLATKLPVEPSSYVQTLTRYLSNIMNSTLLALPREIKELIYFDALSHIANRILALPLSDDVQQINMQGVAALAQDVKYLTDFVNRLENGQMLRENLDELQQTVALLHSDNHEEFYNITSRNRKYGRVDALNGSHLLAKLTSSADAEIPGKGAPSANVLRFGLLK